MLLDDIRTAIEKNLPAETSKSLQERLKLCDRLEGEVADLRQRALEAQDLARLRGITDERERAVAKREAEATKAAADLKHDRELLNMQLACADLRRQDAREFVELLLRNRTVVERVQRQIPVSSGFVTNYTGNGLSEAVPTQSLQNTEETVERTEQ